MELTILGANGTYPTKDGACSSYLLREDGFTMWMDAGNGSVAKLQHHATFGDVDAIFLSHVHVDHCADLYPFFYALLNEPRAIPVFVAPGMYKKLGHLIGDDSREQFNKLFVWHEMQPGDVAEAGPFRMSAFDAAHSTVNTTVRISSGDRTLCYSGDTGPNEHLARAAAGADLFLCEASWLESDIGRMAPIHLTAREAGEAGRAADVGRLMLTHIWPRSDLAMVRAQATETFKGDIELAVETGSTKV